MTTTFAAAYKGHRFPPEIIAHPVWLYSRFPLSCRPVEEILAARGIIVRYEAIREWGRKFGQTYANALQRRRAQSGDKWHLDEVFLKINGKLHYLWRAVDQHGDGLDILVTSRRDKQAAKRFFRTVLKHCQHVLRVLITGKLASYGAGKREMLPGGEHRQHKGLNNRAENSHQPSRQREHQMRRFTSPAHSQCFLSAMAPITGHLRLRHPGVRAADYRAARLRRSTSWNPITGGGIKYKGSQGKVGNRPDRGLVCSNAVNDKQ